MGYAKVMGCTRGSKLLVCRGRSGITRTTRTSGSTPTFDSADSVHKRSIVSTFVTLYLIPTGGIVCYFA